MTPQPLRPQPPVIYSPPADDVIDTYAERVCQTLGTAYEQPEIIDGLAGFLKAVAKAYANILTRDGRLLS